MWANAWLAGRAAPDDVLDALTHWATRQSVTAYDAVAAGSSGLPWPDIDQAPTMSLLQTVRAAAGGQPRPSMAVVLPVPGDVRGLPTGTQFARDALAAGEALLVSGARGTTIGLVPEWPEAHEPEELSWIVYALPGAPAPEQHDLGQAEHDLRSAVRDAADALTSLGTAADTVDDPRMLVAQAMESVVHHPIPDHAPARATRVLDTAAHVDAILTVTAELEPIGVRSLSQAQRAGDALRPLAAVVRSARLAAAGAILRSAWPD